MAIALTISQAQKIVAQRGRAHTIEAQRTVASAIAALSALGYQPPTYTTRVRAPSATMVSISPSPPLVHAAPMRVPQLSVAALTPVGPELSNPIERTNAMPTNWGGIIQGLTGIVSGALGGSTGTSTAPTSSGASSLSVGDIAGGVGTVAGTFIGSPAVGNAAARGAVALPGRNLTSSGGMSDLRLEAGGAGVSNRPRGWSKLRVRSLVRMVGPAAAANILQMPVEDVAIIAISATRRSRGISARDLRVTRRVTRRVLSIARDLGALKPRAPRRAIGTRVTCN